MSEELIECPICHKKMKSIASHIPFIHLMSIKEFKMKYPDSKIQLNCRKKGHFVCNHCNKEFEYKNCLQAHIKKSHPEYFVKETIKKEGHIECAICCKKTDTIYNHVLLKHRCSWESYCEKYGKDLNTRSYFSDEHLKNLSKNKKMFYSSERGIEQRKKQSELYSGEKNPAKRMDVRSKISLSAANRSMSDEISFNRNGISIYFELNNKKYNVRSFEEFKTIYTLVKNNIPFVYEKTIVNYYKEDGSIHRYILDFMINGLFVELKCDKNKIDYYHVDKYERVNKILNSMGKKLIVADYNDICKMFSMNKPLNCEFYTALKSMLDNDKAVVYYVCGKHRSSRILKKVDENYKNHRNIKLKGE